MIVLVTGWNIRDAGYSSPIPGLVKIYYFFTLYTLSLFKQITFRKLIVLPSSREKASHLVNPLQRARNRIKRDGTQCQAFISSHLEYLDCSSLQ
jgi:hypothetical protein